MLKHNPKLNVAFRKSRMISKIRGITYFTPEFLELLTKEIGFQVSDELKANQIMWLAGKFVKVDRPGIMEESGS